jgi:hypothetical protein
MSAHTVQSVLRMRAPACLLGLKWGFGSCVLPCKCACTYLASAPTVSSSKMRGKPRFGYLPRSCHTCARGAAPQSAIHAPQLPHLRSRSRTAVSKPLALPQGYALNIYHHRRRALCPAFIKYISSSIYHQVYTIEYISLTTRSQGYAYALATGHRPRLQRGRASTASRVRGLAYREEGVPLGCFSKFSIYFFYRFICIRKRRVSISIGRTAKKGFQSM